MNILLVEDEKNLVKHIKIILERKGYHVQICMDGKEALEFIELHHHVLDLIILDIMLPNMSGITICKKIRTENIMTPVIMLTAKAAKKDIVEALDYGADDYLTKPFSIEELLARIRALLRRPTTAIVSQITVHNITIWPDKRKVYLKNEEIPLTVKEFDMLLYLAQNPGKVIDRETLLEKIWDINFDTFSNVVDVHVKNLRKKLKSVENNQIIESVRGIGYRIIS